MGKQAEFWILGLRLKFCLIWPMLKPSPCIRKLVIQPKLKAQTGRRVMQRKAPRATQWLGHILQSGRNNMSLSDWATCSHMLHSDSSTCQPMARDMCRVVNGYVLSYGRARVMLGWDMCRLVVGPHVKGYTCHIMAGPRARQMVMLERHVNRHISMTSQLDCHIRRLPHQLTATSAGLPRQMMSMDNVIIMSMICQPWWMYKVIL